MGRIKSIPVKALGQQLLSQYPGKFTADFDKNKAVLAKVKPIRFKRVRNILAGYLANEIRKGGRVTRMRRAPKEQRTDRDRMDRRDRRPARREF